MLCFFPNAVRTTNTKTQSISAKINQGQKTLLTCKNNDKSKLYDGHILFKTISACIIASRELFVSGCILSDVGVKVA